MQLFNDILFNQALQSHSYLHLDCICRQILVLEEGL